METKNKAQESKDKDISEMLDCLDEVVIPGTNNRLTELLILRGVRRGKVLDVNHNSYDLNQENSGGGYEEWVNWGQVERHCLVASMITDILAETCHLDPEKRCLVNLAAFLHDSGKKNERNWQREFPRLAAKPKKELAALKARTDNEEWENAEFGILPAASKLISAITPPSVEGHSSIEEKIMWMADACLSGYQVVPVDIRMDRSIDPTNRNAEHNLRYSNSFKKKYGNKSLLDVQKELAVKYVKEFSDLIGINPDGFYIYLNKEIDCRLQLRQLPLFFTQ